MNNDISLRHLDIRACNFFCSCCNHYVCVCTTGLQAFEVLGSLFVICEHCAQSNFPRGMRGPYSCSRCFHIQLSNGKYDRSVLKEGLQVVAGYIPPVLLGLIGEYAASNKWARFEPKLNVARSLRLVTGRAKKRRTRRKNGNAAMTT